MRQELYNHKYRQGDRGIGGYPTNETNAHM